MWDEKFSSDEIRQGDLLKAVFVPKLKVPFPVLHEPGSVPGDSSPAQFPVAQRTVLVVSQCCTIENGSRIAVAPVRSTPPISSDEERQQYQAVTEASLPSGRNFVFNLHLLDEVDGVLTAGSGRGLAAALDETQTFEAQPGYLNDFVVARMTPHGRRDLRRRLALFWARTEQSDYDYFESLDEDPAANRS